MASLLILTLLGLFFSFLPSSGPDHLLAIEMDRSEHYQTSSHQTSSLSSTTRDFLAGGVARAMSIITTQPLDTARIRMQHSQGKGCGLAQTLMKMVKSEGLLSPMKGLALPLIFTALQSAVIFQTYGYMYRILRPEVSSEMSVSSSSKAREPWRGVWEAAVAGSLAGGLQVAIWSPVEMIKLQTQLQTTRIGDPSHLGPWRIAAQVIRENGLRGLYRGVTVTILRDLPSYGVYFGVYRLLSQTIEPQVLEPSDAGPSTQIIAGGIAGSAAWLSIYPLDVIKSRMQGARAYDRSNTWLYYAKGIGQESGTAGFFRGLGPTLSRAFVMDSVAFLSFTSVLKLLR